MVLHLGRQRHGSALAQYISEQIGAVLEDEALQSSLADLGIEVQFQDYAATVETANNYRTIIKDALVAGGAPASNSNSK